MKKQAIIIYLFVVTLLLASCRKDVELLLSEVTSTDPGASAAGRYAGLYLLNEGNMGSNKATLDFYDFVTEIITGTSMLKEILPYPRSWAMWATIFSAMAAACMP